MTEPTSGPSKRERILYYGIIPVVSALGGALIQSIISHASGDEKSSAAVVAIVNNAKLSVVDKEALIRTVNSGANGIGQGFEMFAIAFMLVGIGFVGILGERWRNK